MGMLPSHRLLSHWKSVPGPAFSPTLHFETEFCMLAGAHRCESVRCQSYDNRWLESRTDPDLEYG